MSMNNMVDKTSTREANESTLNEGNKMKRSWHSLFGHSNAQDEGLNLRFIQPVVDDVGKFAICSQKAVDEEAVQWKNTLVGNFIGRRPSFAYVKETTTKRWILKGGVEMSLLENGIFIFRFTCEDNVFLRVVCGW